MYNIKIGMDSVYHINLSNCSEYNKKIKANSYVINAVNIMLEMMHW